jgi:PAS domain S-box-containing protein
MPRDCHPRVAKAGQNAKVSQKSARLFGTRVIFTGDVSPTRVANVKEGVCTSERPGHPQAFALKTVQLISRLKLSFGIPIVMLIFLSVLSYRSIFASRRGDALVLHTYQVIVGLSGLLSATQEIETGYRGFVLGADPRFLRSYEDGLLKAPAGLATITQLTLNNPEQQRRVARLSTVVGEKIRLAQEVVRVRRDVGEAAATELVSNGSGIKLMDDIRNLIGEMRDNEERLLFERQATARREFNRITLALTLGILGAIVVLGFAGWGVGRDMTARGEIEDAYRRERDRAERYLNTAEVILLARDLDGRITLINRKGCDILGWTESELLGRDWVETCIPVRVRHAIRQRLQDLLAGHLATVENPVLTKSGEERLIDWRNTRLRDDAGQVIGIFSSGTDITDRNQAIEAMRTAEERMRFALEAAGVGIWDVDFRTGVVQWSEILESQYGLKPGTFGGTIEAFLERVHPDDRKSVRDTMTAADGSSGDYFLPHRTILADGTVRWLSGSGRILLGEHGEAVRGVGISWDVTERRTLEVQYQQAQKMEAVGRLAGGVAHDFNNLLTVILGNCELLLTDIGADDARRSDIEEIQKAGRSAAGLTGRMLAFSRKQIIEPVLLDLNQTVADVRTMLGRLIGEDVTMQYELASEPAIVKADRGQMEQVVMNLAVNARDAMPKGGTLRVETANVELDESYAKTHLSVKPGKYVLLTVSDTGSGMTPEVQARLFEPFFTTKEVGKGTGLGLATVHGIVTRSGGSVDVYSEVGAGTSFKVYFPRAEAAKVVAEVPAPVKRPRAGTQTVLVVEDAEGLRELVTRLLKRLGYVVIVAANADEARRLFEENQSIDVLLTDVVMPGASGAELSRQLIELRPSLKVLYMSGYTDEAIVQHGVLNPGIALLNKPFTSETLGRKIREVLSR